MSKVLGTVGKIAGLVSTIARAVGAPQVAMIASAVAAVATPAAAHTAKQEPRPMTAINMFADNRRGYIVTDGAAFQVPTGRIARLEGKVVVFDALSLAIAFHGFGEVAGFTDAMGAVIKEPTQGAFLNGLPAALARYRLRQAVPPVSHTRLCVGVYDRIACQPRFFTVQSGPLLDQANEPPFQLIECGAYFSGFADWAEPERLIRGEPVAGGRRVLAAQRRHAYPSIGRACGVGGECGLYTIDRRGVTYRPLIRYPEAVGEFADPSLPGEVI